MNEQNAAASNAAAIEIDSAFFGQLEQSQPKSDPRMVRWGYNPGLRKIMIPSRSTGLRDNFIPVGKFLPHTTFQTPQENCTLDEYKHKEFMVDVTAADAQATFESALGFDRQYERDWGYKSFGYGETDPVKMAAMNQVLIPTLQEIRGFFGEDSPIADFCKGEDELDIGLPRTHCASCHLEWIKSDACQALIGDAVDRGRQVTVRTAEGLESRDVRFSRQQLEEIRAVVQSGLETFIRQAHKDWATILAELKNKKRDQIQISEQFLRKDLHQPEPENRDVDMLEKVINAQARNQAPVAAPPVDNAVFEQLAGTQRMMAEQMATNQLLLTKLLENMSSNAVPPTEVPSAIPPAEAAPSKTADPKNKAKGAEAPTK